MMGSFNGVPLWILLVISAPFHTHGQFESLDYDFGQSIQQEQQQEIISGGQRITLLRPANKLPVKAINVAHNNRVCSTWGNNHYKNFDGDIFHFPGTCNYVFSSHCKSSYEDFNIQIQRTHRAIESVIMKLDGLPVELSHNSIIVGEKQVQIPYSGSGVQIDKHGGTLTVVSKLGLTLMWHDDDSLLLELDSKYANATCGLCGDFNGIPTYNEFIADDVLITATQFGNLQKMDEPTEQCNDASPTLFTDCGVHESTCITILMSAAFSNCHSLVDVEPYITACIQDLCQCDSQVLGQCQCDTVSEYSRQCTHAGGQPQNWRTQELCPKSCPNNMVYQECGSPCQDTCSNPERSVLCEDHCREGCVCPQGTVYDDINNSGCIPVDQCPCTFNKNTYAAGTSHTTHCSTCLCSGGKWQCENLPCQGRCSVEGGSHITTFDETHYSIHGDCNYVLSKACHGESFIILAEMRKCGLTESETCLKSSTIILNKDTIIVIKPCGSVFVNSIYTQLPMSAANVTIFRPTSFFIVVQTKLGVQIAVQLTPFMQIYVALEPTYKGLTCGLCGNFNDKQSDDFLTMSGVIEGTAASFANTWKTQGTCANIKNVHEDPCALSVKNEKYAKHWCGLLSDANGPFASCHSVVNPEHYQQNCMFDTCSCKKNEDCMCAALSSYVHACAVKGIILTEWRSTVCSKYMSCPNSLTYTYSTDTCQPTCRSLSEPDVTGSITFVPVDGCTCAKDFYMSDYGKCIPADACPCYYKGSAVPSGEVVHDNEMMCTCSKGKLTCIGNVEPACQSPMVYFDCTNATVDTKGSECQKSCQTLDMTCYSAKCVSGCVCPAGLIADGKGGCIKEEDCPCVHNDATYKPGEQIKMKCNTCTCKNRMWECTNNPCLETCSVYGDGHYVTFDGKRYSFNGDCEYVLAQDHCGNAEDSSGTFRIISSNIPCGTTGTTCSKSIKVFLGSYELILTEENFEVVDRGVGGTLPYTVRHMGIHTVIEANNGLILMWDKKTSISIKLSKKFEGKVCGLCGNYDGDGNNDFKTRSQSVVEDVSEFGNSWKISNSCPDAKTPKDACLANPYRKSWAQKQCSILNSRVFSACHSLVDSSKYYEACVSDSCACDTGGDCECFCTAIAAYAQVCGESGICVNWRTPSVCPLFCDYFNPEGECDWHYKPCGSPCMKTCRNPTGKCSQELSGLEGCYPTCPPDTFFDEDELKCVDRCGCYDDTGKHFKIGETVPSKENCHKCECTLSGVDCKFVKEACHCEYKGKMYPYKHTIYNTTDGTGGCMTAVCNENGEISRDIYPCPTTATSTFTFTTTHQPSTEEPATVTHPKTTNHQATAPTTHSTTKSTPTVVPATHPKTSTLPHITESVCPPKCKWSQWIDVSTPDVGLDGDFETYERIQAAGHKLCPVPYEIECRAAKYPDVPISNINQVFHCDVKIGLVCNNDDQIDQLCLNYEIKVRCCDDYSHCNENTTATTSTTEHINIETATHPKPSSQQCFCHINEKLYKPGDTIYNKKDDAGCIFFAKCNEHCEIERHKGPCIDITPVPTPKPQTPPEKGCSNRKINETWINDRCEEVTCQGNGITTHKEIKCPELTPLTCANGFPSVKRKDADGCCEHYECQCVCSGWGDPHYITFDGVYYNFLDNCTYVLVQQITPKYDHFRVLVENHFCDAVGGLSCPKSIFIYYKSNEIELTRQMHKGSMTNMIKFNNDWVSPGFTRDGIIISSLGINMQVEIPEIDAFISFSGLIFYISLPFSKFGDNTEGQCGTCTNSSAGGCRMPDGQIVKDCGKMAPHWRVKTPGCDQHVKQKTAPPSPPTTCPPSSLCNIILGDVFAKCHKVIDPKPFHKGCVFDACHVKDEEVSCSSLEVYADICSANGVCVDWRSKTGGLCSITCPDRMVYKACGPVNVDTCENKKVDITSITQTEGCYCPEGTTLFNSHSHQCVKICGCSDQGKAKEPGERWISGCSSCVCEPNSLTTQCEPLLCSPLPPLKCDKDGFIPVTINDPDNPCCPGKECRCNSTFCTKEKEKTCPVGFLLELSPKYLSGEECCPTYICTPLPVCVVNDKIYQPGMKLPKDASDPCKDCFCSDEKDPKTDFYQVKCNQIACNSTCNKGYQYQKDGNTCCGHCVKVECILKEHDKTILIQPSKRWSSPEDPCVTYVCEKSEDHLILKKVTETCQICEPGSESMKREGECCPKCIIPQPCVFTPLGASEPITLKPDEPWTSPKDKCTSYECKKESDGHFVIISITKECDEHCDRGYEYVKEEGKCCGFCKPIGCPVKMKDNSVKVVKPGEHWSPPEEPCLTYFCERSKDNLVLREVIESCSKCGLGYEYIKEEGKCCGYCKPIFCPVKMNNIIVKDLPPGEKWSPPENPCLTFICEISKDNLVVKEVIETCSECGPGYENIKEEGKCCGCKLTSCPVKINNIIVKDLPPGERWTHPEDPCITFFCEKSKGNLVFREVMETCSNCGPGYEYIKEEGKCCGDCMPIPCSVKMNNITVKVLQPGEKWSPPEDPCKTFVCEKSKDSLVVKKIIESCSKCGLGSEGMKIEGECCPKCIISQPCVFTPPGASEPITIKRGESWTSPKDKCTSFECKKESDGHFVIFSIAKECDKNCASGYEYVNEEGKCCGFCKPVGCPVKMKDNSVKVVKPGELWSPPADPCLTYFCERSKDNPVLKEVIESCSKCGPGYEYIKEEGKCCGDCKQTSCPVKMNNNTVKVLQPGEKWSPPEDPCLTYVCEKSKDNLVAKEMIESCSNCGPGFENIKEEGKCCGECKMTSCLVKMMDKIVKVLKPNESWSPPENPCVTYVCDKDKEHPTLKKVTVNCPICEPSSEGIIEGECCPICVIPQPCVFTPPGALEPITIQPGERWIPPKDNCSTYECKKKSDGLLEIISITVECDKHCGPEYKYVPEEGQCCGYCNPTACSVKLKDNTVHVIKPGEKWIPPEEPCRMYVCKRAKDGLIMEGYELRCSKCEPGYENIKLEGTCCGGCIPMSCEVTINNHIVLYLLPGQKWSPPEDPCLTYFCEKSKDNLVVKVHKEVCSRCELGSLVEKIEGECCLKCINPQPCVFTPPGASEPITIKPGKPWTKDNCTFYVCQEAPGGHSVVLRGNVLCDEDCGPGYEYVNGKGGCCGFCNLTACSVKLKTNTVQLIKPGEKWIPPEDPCHMYVCKRAKDGLIMDEVEFGCSKCGPGYKSIKEEGTCCGGCIAIACPVPLNNNTVKVIQPGVIWSPPGDPCLTYLCEKTKDGLEVSSNISFCSGCELGSEAIQKEGECCPICISNSCVLTPSGASEPITIKPGQTWTSPKDKCTTYECKESDGKFVISNTTKDCAVRSDEDCDPGFKYIGEEGECCGHCKQTSCPMKMKDNTVKVLKPGEKWTPPQDICITYECKEESGGNFVTSIKTKDCSVTSDHDCLPGYKYVREEGKCCGHCIPVACVIKLKDDEAKILQPGETWTSPTDKCTTYECKKESDGHLIISSTSKDCAVYSEADCGPGFEYIKKEGECCGHCKQTSCPMKMKDNTIKVLQPGEEWTPPEDPCVTFGCWKNEDHFNLYEKIQTCPKCDGYEGKKVKGECCPCTAWNPYVCVLKIKSEPIELQPGQTWTSPTDKCTTYKCKFESNGQLVVYTTTKDCRVLSKAGCGPGFEYIKEEGECCGNCKQTSCPMKMKDKTVKVLKPGESWTSPDDKCTTYECKETSDGQFHFSTKTKDCSVTSDKDCPEGTAYKKAVEGQCCGTCEKVACVINDVSPPVTLKPGDVYRSQDNKCLSYKCSSTFDLVKETQTCPAFNPADCVEGTIHTTDDGCCKTCTSIVQRCQAHKKSDKIRSGACVSEEPVEISSCGGGCMTSSIYSPNSNSMEHKCSCCQEKKTSKKEVTLHCPDGSSKVYTYVYADECGCTSTECDKQSQISQ